MTTDNRCVHLQTEAMSLVITHNGTTPAIAYWGSPLGNVHAASLAAALERPVPGGGPDSDAPLALIPEATRGWFGAPGVEGSRPTGTGAFPAFTVVSAHADANSATFQLVDTAAQLSASLAVNVAPGGVVAISATVRNDAPTDYNLTAFRVAIPVAAQAREVLTVGGRWTNEFGQTRTVWDQNTVAIQNRRLKTSHERLPVVFAGTPGFSEQHGEVWGCHIGWSGNYELLCDAQTDARRHIAAGELLSPGEVTLTPGQSYTAPPLYLAYANGLNAVSNAFHTYLRSLATHPTSPRKVLLNTWEAVYFNHDLATLTALADRAAEVGIERFVLDDGWFHLRRNDTAGLGDWWVDPAVWPHGLAPLIDHVRGLGMEFGIWVEPEMVNPDSDLYRNHPDWALHDHEYPLVLSRNQLVLDLGRSEVRDYLFTALHALLRDHDIAYVKWDMNRDLAATDGAHGRPGGRAQTLGVYELFARLRAAHPNVEFESCASGGGRVDFGILEHTRRVWTSDSIDALDRQAIQRGFSLLFPPEIMGSHIGSDVCHTTGRRHSLAMRAQSAFFGSLGVEWNLLDRDAAELSQLAHIISLHKHFRPLLHSGTVVRVDHPDHSVNVHGVVAADRRAALVSVVRLHNGPSLHTAPIRIIGLEPDTTYHLHRVELAPNRFGPARRQPSWLTEGLALTGRQLAAIGVNTPVLNPESGILIHLSTSPIRSTD